VKTVRRALVSVSDKTGVLDLARGLEEGGFEIVSTGGTARALEGAGVKVTSIADVTGFPELLEGRVKTLHPAVHAGILARRSRPDDVDAVARLRIGLIDVVVANLYPFERAAADPEVGVDALLEEIDIGGPTLVRAAAKSFRDVLVAIDPGDYQELLAQLARPEGASPEFRLGLARKAFAHTAAYDAAIAATLQTLAVREQGYDRSGGAALGPGPLVLIGRKLADLRYGENPHQRAAWYAHAGVEGFADARVLQGKGLSFTNLLDLDAAARIVLEFDEPAAAVVKHSNPCGAAIGATGEDAYLRARDADAQSAFGGIVGLNRPLDDRLARALTSTFIEAVVAPEVLEEARPILGLKPNLRVLCADLARYREPSVEARSILGAWLVQERDRIVEARSPWGPGTPDLRVVTRRAPTSSEWRALSFAWRVAGHVKSNAVIFTAADRTLAIGAGQMSRVDAVSVAIAKAKESLGGAVAASDAFFPFRDGLDLVAGAGATAVVQPGGSVRDAEVIAAADEHGLAMVFTGRRHFRH
jgi:phosphoribosylaminoimidazolecarboxamide formyltransferase/IMP cyclohydrolase